MAPGVYAAEPQMHTLQPIVTGSTVVAVKFNGGVVMASDTLVSYGSQARYKDVCRMKTVGGFTLMGASGEFSDFQHMGDMLDEQDNDDFLHEDNYRMGPKEYYSYIGRVMYNRRTKMNPLYNQFVVAGKKGDGESLLGFVDHQGTMYEDNFIATGFGSHLAMPLLRNEWRPEITLEEATALLQKCLKICFYRDCRAYCKIHIGVCSGSKPTISEPQDVEHFWGHNAFLRKTLEGAGVASAASW